MVSIRKTKKILGTKIRIPGVVDDSLVYDIVHNVWGRQGKSYFNVHLLPIHFRIGEDDFFLSQNDGRLLDARQNMPYIGMTTSKQQELYNKLFDLIKENYPQIEEFSDGEYAARTLIHQFLHPNIEKFLNRNKKRK